MATKPSKPQGTKPNKKGGNFVDPLSKWDADGEDFEEDDEEEEDRPARKASKATGKAKKPETTADKAKKKAKKLKDEAYENLVDTLVDAPDSARDLIDKLSKRLTNPQVSAAERLSIQHELVDARKALQDTEKGIEDIVKELGESRRLEAQAYAKLNRIRTWREQPGHEAGLDPEALASIKSTEAGLKKFITSMTVFQKTAGKDEDVRKHMMNAMNELVDKVSDLPDEFKDMFEEDESRLDEIIRRQKEARDFVKNQNDAIKKALWATADKMGFGALNVGNLIRGVRSVWNAPKRIKNGVSSVANKFRTGRDYIKKTIEMRRLAAASPIEAEDPTLHADYIAQKQTESRQKNGTLDAHTKQLLDRLSKESKDKPWTSSEKTDAHAKEDATRQGEKQNSLIERYVEGAERFHSRLLMRLGRKNDKKEKKEDDGGLLKGMMDLFGSGGIIRKLLGVAASLSAVALAGAIGYWVGSQIWKKISPWAAEKFNTMSGLDEAGNRASKPAQVNTEENFARAQSIRTAIKTKNAKKLTPEDREFYQQFLFDNPNIDLEKPYDGSGRWKGLPKAGAGRGKINPPLASPTESGAPTTDGANGGSGRGSVNPPMSIPVPAFDAGSGRGNINPPSISQETPNLPAAVSTGPQVMDAWMGKTMTKSGDVDVKNINPAMQSNMVNLAQDYFDATGKKLQVNSGFRSIEEQTELYRTKPKGYAAKPGASLHNFGLAVDVSSQQANELNNLGLIQKYGFTRPMQKEPWHLQPVGMTVVAAKSGVYSADAPADQGSGKGATATTARPQTQSVAEAEPRIPVTDTSGSEVGTGSSGKVQTIGGGKKSASDIPLFDTKDGHLLAMNTGAI